MPKLIAIFRLLLSPLLVILAACGVGGNSYTHGNRIANGGHDVLSSKGRVQDGVARFDCKPATAAGATTPCIRILAWPASPAPSHRCNASQWRAGTAARSPDWSTSACAWRPTARRWARTASRPRR